MGLHECFGQRFTAHGYRSRSPNVTVLAKGEQGPAVTNIDNRFNPGIGIFPEGIAIDHKGLGVGVGLCKPVE